MHSYLTVSVIPRRESLACNQFTGRRTAIEGSADARLPLSRLLVVGTCAARAGTLPVRMWSTDTSVQLSEEYQQLANKLTGD